MPVIQVLFLCKLCNDSFCKVQQFLEHKEEKHFAEFQNLTCIVFEEKTSSDLSDCTNADYHVHSNKGDHNVTGESPIPLRHHKEPIFQRTKLHLPLVRRKIPTQSRSNTVALPAKKTNYSLGAYANRKTLSNYLDYGESAQIKFVEFPNQCQTITESSEFALSAGINSDCSIEPEPGITADSDSNVANDFVDQFNEEKVVVDIKPVFEIADSLSLSPEQQIQMQLTTHGSGINIRRNKNAINKSANEVHSRSHCVPPRRLTFKEVINTDSTSNNSKQYSHHQFSSLKSPKKHQYSYYEQSQSKRKPEAEITEFILPDDDDDDPTAVIKAKTNFKSGQFQFMSTPMPTSTSSLTSVRKALVRCSICSKSFPSHSLVANHMRTHTGERPFECHLCGQQYTQKSSLNRHLYAHNSEKRFLCSLCPFQTTRRPTLVKHVLRIHPGNSLIIDNKRGRNTVIFSRGPGTFLQNSQ